MNRFREETDLLGAVRVPADALWGAHTQRALENFPLAQRPVHRGLAHAYGAVKLAAARANHELAPWPEPTRAAIEQACEELRAGRLDEWIVVDALQGGAGTSTNMNVNEVLANRALQIVGHHPADYHAIDPHDDLNRHQSTNDTYPTALRIAAVWGLRALERRLIALQEAFQRKEHEMADVVKVARTELQDAVLTTLGREMSAYAEAFGRDRWRIYKCEERLRVVNLGGTAVGTGLGAPRRYIFRVVEHLKQITGLGLARAENLVDATQNADVFAEVSGMVRALAVNLMKVANDLRLLSSGPRAGLGEIRLPARQAGSSIMPGKVNPVVPEAVAQAGMAVVAYDAMIVQAAAAGNLDLNPFLPLVADALLSSLDLMANACDLFARLCVDGIEADPAACRRHVDGSTAMATALVERIGYDAAERLAVAAIREGKPVRQLAVEAGLVTEAEFDALTAPHHVTRLGTP